MGLRIQGDRTKSNAGARLQRTVRFSSLHRTHSMADGAFQAADSASDVKVAEAGHPDSDKAS